MNERDLETEGANPGIFGGKTLQAERPASVNAHGVPVCSVLHMRSC